jgi:multidrug efflux system membrane fusion protein
MGGPPPVPVMVGKAAKETVPVELNVVGTAEASAIVQVKSQVAGQLMSVHFTEGQNVEQGALLFKIDERPYVEALRQAEAALARDQAQLNQTEAALARDIAQSKNADADAVRNNELARAGVIAKAQLDQIVTAAEMYREAVRASRATVETARAALKSDQAAIERTKLDLNYCTITAPIAGRTGNLLVNAGNMVKSNDTSLVVIHRLAPIFVNFSVPERHLGTIRRLNSIKPLAVKVSVKDNPGTVGVGHLAVIDNTVDASTGTIRLKGVFENADRKLWPGAFVDVVLGLESIPNAITVPSESIQTGQKGQYVYLVKPDMSAEVHIVTVGPSYGGKTVVESGLQPGDTVVTDGQLRLYPGAIVKPGAAKL